MGAGRGISAVIEHYVATRSIAGREPCRGDRAADRPLRSPRTARVARSRNQPLVPRGRSSDCGGRSNMEARPQTRDRLAGAHRGSVLARRLVFAFPIRAHVAHTVLLQNRRATRDEVIPGLMLRGDTEDDVNNLTLSYRIALGDPADLSFSDFMHRLVTLDRSPCSLRRMEAEACRDSLLDEAMVLLNDVVQMGAVRQRQRRPSSPDCFNSAIAPAYAGCRPH
jgi:hypothetical protein